MSHSIPSSNRNRRTFIATLLAYAMLTSQLAPMAMAFNGSANRRAPAQTRDVERKEASEAPPQERRIGAFAPVPVPLRVTPLGSSPIIAATKVDSFLDPDMDGKVSPGQTITYSVTISNTGTGPGTNVTLDDTVDPNTTIVPGSAVATPIAFADAYNVIGNVRIQPNAAQGLLANDINPNTGNNTGLTASGGTTSTQGGNLAINADGSFSYNPPVGFTGTDTFTYTATSANGVDTRTVALTVAGMIFFVNASSPAGGDGRLTNPFNCLVGGGCFSTSTADEAGDNIFLLNGAYTGGLTFLANQKLIGQGATDTLANIAGVGAVQPYSDPLPVTNGSPSNVTITTATNALTVSAGGITLRGFTVGNTTGAKILGSAFGTLTAGNNTSPDLVLSGTGQALNLTTGTFAATSAFLSVATTSSGTQGITLSGVAGTVSFGSTTVSGATTQGILVGTTTANINFGNTSVTGGTDGVSFQNNSSGTRTFGTLGVSGGSANAFLHGAGGGNVTVGGAANLSSGNNPIEIQSSAAATINFAGGASATRTTAGGTGVNWAGANAAGTLTFNSLTIGTTNGVGLAAAGGGTLNVTNGTGAINSTPQAATAITATGVTLNANFLSVSSAGGVNGITLTNVSGTSNFGTGSLTGATGATFLVSGGIGTVTYSGTITQDTVGQRVVDIQAKTAGAITLGGAVSSTGGTGTGIIVNNVGAAVAFQGGINLVTNTNTAFTAMGGGTGSVSATQNNTTIVNTLTTTTGTALNVTNTTIGASGLTFRSISSNGGANNGIILNNTGSTAGLTVSGNGGSCTSAATCTGGAIQNKTGADGSTTQGSGIFLNDTSGVSLDRMQLNSFDNFAIRGTTVIGFSLTNSNINGVNGNNGAFNEGSVSFDGLTGSAAINSCNISGAWEDNVRVLNTGGTLNRLNVTNTTIGLNSLNDGNNGIGLEATGVGTILNATISGGTFTGTRADWINATTQTNSTMDIDVLNNTFSNNHTNSGSGGVRVIVASNGNTTYNIAGNTLRDSKGSAIFANAANTAAILAGRIENNTIGVVAVANSGSSEASGISLESNGGGDHTSLVNNNTIRQYNNHAIIMTLGTTLGNPTNINFTITGNTATNPGTVNNDFNAIHLNNGTAPGENFTSCVDVGGAGVLANDVDQGADGASAQLPNTADIRLRQRQSTTVRLPGYGGANNNDAAVQAYLRGRNITRADPDGAAASNTVPTGGGFIGGAICTQPPASPKPGDEEKPDSGDDKGSPALVEQIASTNSITSRPFISSPRQQPAVTGGTATAQVVVAPRPVSAAGSAPELPKITGADGPAANPPVIAGDNLTWNVGTLPAGQSVTITFQVTVDNPFMGAMPEVSNQGTVTADGGISVLTDDPSEGGSNDPTVTGVTLPPDLFVRDASVAEPASGSSQMIFTLALSTPAPTGGIVVTVSTANGTATGGTCVAGDDYASVTGGTATFAVGEQIKTFPVTVCSDANVEGDETLFLNVDSAPGAVIVDGQGLGTITANVAGTTLISELRTSGPAGAGDDFVEIYNNTDTPFTVPAGGYGLFKRGATCDALPVLVGTIPAATVIPQRGHYLFVGSTYSLTVYAGGNAVLTTDIESDFNVGLFSTVDPLAISTANRLDAVGFIGSAGGICDVLREGTALPQALASTSEYSFVREFTLFSNDVPTPTDGNDNAADFTLVSTTPSTPVGSTAAPRLGAPGPENLAGPNWKKYSQVGAQLIDPMLSSSAQPNRFRDSTSDPANNSLLGTLALRRTFTNNTGAPITRLRFRTYDITTFPQPVGTADLRARTSTNATVTVTGVGSVTALATTLETPPAQPSSGGLNSSLAAGTVTMGTPLAAGASIHINFLFGVQQSGSFRVFVFVEAVP